MNAEESTLVIQTILAGWPMNRQRMTTEDVRAFAVVYAAGLSDLDYDVVKAALYRVIRISKFLPTVAELRQAAGVVVYGDKVTGVEAWGSVVKAIKERGSHRRPGTKEQFERGEADFWFKDPLTAKVTRLMNWADLCAGDHDTMVSNRARFIDAYEQLASNERLNTLAATGLARPVTALPESAERQPVGPAATRMIAPPDERSSILREVLNETRAEKPERVGLFVNSLALKLGIPTGDGINAEAESTPPTSDDVH